MSCQRQILGVKWHDRVKNIDIADRTGLPNIADIISKRHQALFGHVVWHGGHLHTKRYVRSLQWKAGRVWGWTGEDLLHGRPRKTWIQQIGSGTPAFSWRQMWQSADERGHRGESPQRTSISCLRVMMMMMMMPLDAGERTRWPHPDKPIIIGLYAVPVYSIYLPRMDESRHPSKY